MDLELPGAAGAPGGIAATDALRRRVSVLSRLQMVTRTLLRSVADGAGASGVAAVLTGMGDDGAQGLLAVRRSGGSTFAQDAATATVDGMPRAARDLGAAQHILPLAELGAAVATAARRARRR